MKLDRRRRQAALDAGLRGRMMARFVIAILLSSAIFTLGFLMYYWIAYIAGENLFREFVVVYRQHEAVERVEIDGREVERRSYRAEAQPETTRWRIIAPPIILNNVLVAVVLCLLAVGYSHRFSGPVYRISSDIGRVLAGQRGVRTVLRRRDELKELASRVNSLIERLEQAEEE